MASTCRRTRSCSRAPPRTRSPTGTAARISERRRGRAASGQRHLRHGRHVRGDDLPAEIGETHPGLALTADEVTAAHLELEIHGGEVAAEREDLQSPALLL